MTQFQIPDDQAVASSPRTSAMAITALVFSLICCIPTTVLGLILGVISAVQIAGNPQKKGMGIAVVAIVLGLIFSGAQAVLYPMGWKVFADMATLMAEGPAPAMEKGYAGDLQGFRDSFYGNGATASDAEVQAFLDSVKDACGDFQSALMTGQPAMGDQQPVITYSLTFSDTVVNADVQLIFSDPASGSGGLINKLGSIEVILDDGNVIAFPH